jgi:hypothetical protein
MWCGELSGVEITAGAGCPAVHVPPVEIEADVKVHMPIALAGHWTVDVLTRLSNVLGDLCLRFIAMLEQRPGAARVVLGGFAIVVATLTMSQGVHAGLLDDVQNQFQAGTANWMTNALTVANALFAMLAVIVIAYNMVAYYLAFESVKGMVVVILKTMLSLGLPWLILILAPNLLGNLVGAAQQLATGVTGNNFNGVTADALLNTGLGIGWGLLKGSFQVFSQTHFTFNPLNPGGSLGADAVQLVADVIFVVLALVLCVSMIFAFTFIAVEYLLAFMQALFSLPLGAWALGFMATPGTSGMAAGVWSGIIQTMVRFVAILAGATFAENVAQNWNNGLNAVVGNWGQLTAGGAIDTDAFKTILSYTLGAFALLYIVRQLPQLAMAALSGAPVFSGARVVDSAAGAAMSAGSMALGAPGAAMQAAMVAKGMSAGWSGASGTYGSASLSEKTGAALGSAAEQAKKAREIRNLFKG